MKKTGLCVLVGLVMLVSLFTLSPAGVMADSVYGDFTYTVSGSEATITGYTGPGGDVTVPGTVTDGVNTYNVTAIGDYAFWEIFSLTSITVPDGITSIGFAAFYNCNSLTSINFPVGLTYMGDHAFNSCSSLASVTLPDSLTSVGKSVFSLCYSLSFATFPVGLTSIGDWAFSHCTSLTSITLPDSVTSIGNQVFYFCVNIASITFPASLASMGDWVCGYCTSLSSINLPSGLTSIGGGAFQHCSNLNSACFFGAKPVLGSKIFDYTASGFTFYYHVSQTASWAGYADYPSAPFCILTIDNQDGSPPAGSIAMVDGGGHITAPSDPVRPGYTFNGWYKEPACVNIFDFAAEVITDDVTLYAGWVSLTPDQTWHLDSAVGAGEYRVMEKTGTQTGAVPVEGTTELWLSNVPAGTGGVVFEDGTWTVHLENTFTGEYSIQIGQSNGTHGDFTTFHYGANGPTTGPIHLDFDLTNVSVPAGLYLALLVNNTGAGSVITDGTSYLTSPDSTPSYPVPELAAGVLLALGLGGLAIAVIIRRKKLA